MTQGKRKAQEGAEKFNVINKSSYILYDAEK